MLLMRYVFLIVSEIPEDLSVLNKDYGDVSLKTGSVTDFNSANKVLSLIATIKLDRSPIDADQLLGVPDRERRECEQTIERVSRIWALCNAIRIEIRTPSGVYVGFFAEHDEELKALKLTKGGNSNNSKLILKGAPPLTEFDWEIAFADRNEGVLLMSEGLNQTSFSGQFRDFIRLFENAFGMSTKQFKKKLLQCLNVELGYTSREIDHWVSLRDPLSHADKINSSAILYEADVAPVIWRVRQAAYDILLNKKVWGDRNSERRLIWSPDCFSTNSADEFSIRVGAKRVGYYMTDPFNVYSIMLGVTIRDISDNVVLFVPRNDESVV